MTTETAEPLSPLPALDPFQPEALADPVGFVRRIRAEAPVSWIPALGANLLVRHADVLAALKDDRLVTGNLSQGVEALTAAEQEELRPVRASMNNWMGHTDPADHTRFQQLLKRYFTPATVHALRPRIRELTGELLDAVAGRDRVDVVAELAYPLPANIIAEMFGMPTSDRERLRAWSADISALFGIADADRWRAGQRSVLEMQDYLRPLLDERRDRPREDLLSVFAEAERDGLVTEDEIVANCVLLLFAGHETTAMLIANGLLLLLQHPEQLARLRADPELTPAAVEEMMRCDGPVGVVSRVTTGPVELAGHTFPAGRHLYLGIGAANRDPAVFADPDAFDITRKPNRHIGFGMGVFYCLGAALARTEADEFFRLLLARQPSLALAEAAPDRVPVPPLGRRLRSLTVTR